MFAKLILLFLATATHFEYNSAHDKIVYCYFGSWAVYRPGNGKYIIENTDPFLCTHISYTFVGLNNDASIKIIDPWADLPNGLDGYGKLNRLKYQNPKLKTLIAIGGWNAGSETFSTVFKSRSLRKQFASNAVEFVKQYGFNGFDVDWEYPNQRGGVKADIDDFTEVLKELQSALNREGLILSGAFGATQSSASQSYDIKSISKYVDIINIMTYDLHGAWDNYVGLNSPLYPRSSESAADKANLNVKACLDYWISEGAPPEKLTIGIPVYGHTYKLSNHKHITPGSPSSGTGIAGPYTQQAGTIGFNEFCEYYANTWTQYYDEEQRAPYAVYKDDWLGFDNATSVGEKVNFAMSYNLGGAMIWSIETDDFLGFCGVKNGILQKINDVFNEKA